MALKLQLNVLIDESTVEALRERSRALGVPLAGLANTYLRFALAKVPDEVARKLVPPDLRHSSTSVPSVNEQKTLSALRALSSAEGARVLTLTEIATAAGLRLALTLSALYALRSSQEVGGWVSHTVDRFGRPTESLWWLSEYAPAWKLEAFAQLVTEMRQEMLTREYRPEDLVAVRERFISRLGVTPAALRIKTVADHKAQGYIAVRGVEPQGLIVEMVDASIDDLLRAQVASGAAV